MMARQRLRRVMWYQEAGRLSRFSVRYSPMSFRYAPIGDPIEQRTDTARVMNPVKQTSPRQTRGRAAAEYRRGCELRSTACVPHDLYLVCSTSAAAPMLREGRRSALKSCVMRRLYRRSNGELTCLRDPSRRRGLVPVLALSLLRFTSLKMQEPGQSGGQVQ